MEESVLSILCFGKGSSEKNYNYNKTTKVSQNVFADGNFLYSWF